jgi:drug/metabolite transporter (DMT)-like permease
MTAILWGTSFPVISIGLKGGINPETFVFLRFLFAALLMFIFTLGSGRKVLARSRSR